MASYNPILHKLIIVPVKTCDLAFTFMNPGISQMPGATMAYIWLAFTTLIKCLFLETTELELY